MNHAWVLWILTACSALHVVEEYSFGWQGWAVATLGPKYGVWVSTTAFGITNASMVVVAIAASEIGWRAPGVALGFAALLIVDAAWGHVLPSIQAKRFNPGLFTAVLLYIPIGVWAYAAAHQDHALSAGNFILSIAIGAALLAQALIIPRFAPKMRYPDVAIPDVTADKVRAG